MTFYNVLAIHWLFILTLSVLSSPAHSNETLWRGALVGSVITYLWGNPLEMDTLGFEGGYHTDRDILALKINNGWDLKKGLIQKKNYRLDTQLRFNLSYWQLGALSNEGDNFKRHQLRSTNAELGIHFSHHFTRLPFTIGTFTGISYLSAEQLAEVQYGSHVGFVNGLIFAYPYSEQTALSLSYFHYSNNDIAEDNPPDNFIYAGYQHHFATK